MSLTKKIVENLVTQQMEDRNFEDLLEDFDLTPEEVFWKLFTQGYIDPELMENLYGTSIEGDYEDEDY